MGDAVADFEPGTVYVLHFWCTASLTEEHIAKLTELQERYAKDDLIVIAQHVHDDDHEKIVRYVTSIKDRLKCRVALDDYSRHEAWLGNPPPVGQMEINWVKASGYIRPVTMVVSRTGELCCIGNLAFIEEPLVKVIAGTFDIAGEAKRREIESRFWRAFRPIIDNAANDEHNKTVERVLALMEEFPTKAGESAVWLFQFLVEKHQYELAYNTWGKVYAKFSNDSSVLCLIAEVIITAEMPDSVRDLDLAERLARQASRISEDRSPADLRTLAYVLRKRGRLNDAVKVMERAIEFAEGADERAFLEEDLRQFNQQLPK